jgi:putative selenium metabolism protein SsnA
MTNTYIIKCGTILTFDPMDPVRHHECILVEGGRIIQIAPEAEFSLIECERIDATDKVVMPGLINSHHHFYSSLVTGLGKAAPSADFNQVLENLWWRLDKKLLAEDNYISAMVSILTAIRKGTTTIIDHHASPFSITGSLSQIAKAVSETGIRASLAYEVSDRDGEARCAEGIAENADWIRTCQMQGGNQLRGLFGMHAAFTLGDKTLDTVATLVQELGCGTHIHAAEADSDEQYNLKHYGLRVAHRLDSFGLINPLSILAHGVYLDDDELELIGNRGAVIVTNPQSNLNNAVGIANLVNMQERGICIGLGTDAMTVNMLEELRVAMWAQHLRQANPTAAFMEVASTLLFNNPLIAQKYWGEGHGQLVQGAAADLIFVDYDPHTPLNNETWIGHVIYGISQAAVDSTIVGGKFLMWNRELLLDIDEAEIKAKSRELAGKLWERF